jgi:flagellar basal-body rod protein FlgG
MTGEIYMAATGALAYEKRLGILSNNLANVNTVGFKQDKSRFQKYFLTELSQNKLNRAAGGKPSQASSFWFRMSTYTDLTPGPMRETGNRFDLAINGNGFFCVQTPRGIQYTRRGDFGINAEGTMVTQEGWPVLGEGGEITIESEADVSDPQRHEFIVDDQGNVAVDGNTVGKLRIVDFADADALKKIGDTYFRPRAATMAGTEATDYRISQGMLEHSNVNAVKMMTELIEVHRGYESYQKIIRSVDEVNSKTINEVGKPV